MKKYHIGMLFCLLFIGLTSSAQSNESINIPLSNPGEEGKLIVHVIEGSITVKRHNAQDVVVEASRRSNKYKNKNKSKGGLKRIGDNSMSFTVEEYDNKVKVRPRSTNNSPDFTIYVPKNFSVDIKAVNNGKINVDGLNGTHEVSNTNGPVVMTNVGGSVIADALNENIRVTFASVYNDTSMMFTSLNGDIDVTFPSNIKATVAARSDNGNVYTDFEMTTSKSSQTKKSKGDDGVYRVTQTKGVTGEINGGGIDIGFKTLNGDILIRSNN